MKLLKTWAKCLALVFGIPLAVGLLPIVALTDSRGGLFWPVLKHYAKMLNELSVEINNW